MLKQMTECSRQLEALGVRLFIRSAFPGVLRQLEHDFSYFLREGGSPSENDFVLEIGPPPKTSLGWHPLFSTAHSTIFRAPAGETRVSFFARAWVRYRFAQGRADIWCDDEEVAYETCYLVILSYLGERLDRKGIHRLHGLGLAFGESGMVLLAPSGGGKSTIALNVLGLTAGPAILSDDTPLVTRDGTMFPFPQRIALKERPAVSSESIRVFRRVLYGEKWIIGSDFFRSRVSKPVPVRWLVLLRRDGSPSARFETAGRWRMVWPLAKWLVVGHETPQIWQLFLRPSPGDVLAKARILFSRLRAAVGLLMRARPYTLSLSGDPRECAEVIGEFMGRAA